MTPAKLVLLTIAPILIGCSASSTETRDAGADAADGGAVKHTIDESKLGDACTTSSDCPNGKGCAELGGFDRPVFKRCVELGAYCAAVTCSEGFRCLVAESEPPQVSYDRI